VALASVTTETLTSAWMLEVGSDSAKDDTDATQGVKRLAEALLRWLAS
jgi:hypothetical protein